MLCALFTHHWSRALRLTTPCGVSMWRNSEAAAFATNNPACLSLHRRSGHTEVLLELGWWSRKKAERLVRVEEQPYQMFVLIHRKSGKERYKHVWKDYLESQRHLRKLLRRSPLNSVVQLRVFFNFLILCRKLKVVPNWNLARVCNCIIGITI